MIVGVDSRGGDGLGQVLERKGILTIMESGDGGKVMILQCWVYQARAWCLSPLILLL